MTKLIMADENGTVQEYSEMAPPQAQHTATRRDDDDWILTGDEPEQVIEREGDGQTRS